MRQVYLGSCCMVLLALAATPAGAQEALGKAQVLEMREQAMQGIEQMRQARRAEARPIDLLSPFYSVAGDDETEIHLLNAVADPVRVELAALNATGEVLPLGAWEIGVTRHLTIPLRDAVRAAGESFHQGSLRLSLLGDAYTVQAWSVVRRGRQLAELQFQARYKAPRNDMAALWDAAAAPGSRPVFRLLNAGDAPLTWRAKVIEPATYVIETVGEKRSAPVLRSPVRYLSGSLEPGQIHRLEPGVAGAGFVRIQHDGERYDLRVAGLLEGPEHLSLIPVVAREKWENTSVHEAIRVSWDPAVAGSAGLSLFNLSDSEMQATVEAFDSATGEALLSTVERIAPGQPVALDPGSRIAAALGDVPGRDVRLRVTSERPGLLVSGTSRQADGAVDDITLLHPDDAHASGNYPMLPLETHETFLTLLNVGDQATSVVAQFYWDGGTYSYGPVQVEANGSYRLAVDDIVIEGKRDMLGQTLAADPRHGFLKWSARGGSNAIVGRTEARPRGGRDTFGFNCNQCCGEWPWGDVIPGAVDFFVGQTPSFEAAYRISTCNGTMGPFPASPTSYNTPSPFTWNGENVGASAPASDTVVFYGYEQGAVEGGVCFYQNFSISGDGDPDSCDSILIKGHNVNDEWNPNATCTSQLAGVPNNLKCGICNACCNQILAWKICSKTGLLTANSEHSTCLGHCATDVC